MKNIYRTIALVLLMGVTSSCSDFLDVNPQGYLLEDDMSDPAQIDKLLMAAYAELGNDEINRPLSLWNYGSVRADDAYKGGRDMNDGDPLHFLEIANNIDTNSWYQNGFWAANYNAISRCNTVIRLLNSVSEEEYPEKDAKLAEARFLRGHFYFIQKITFKMIPYIDETMTSVEAAKVSNVELTNDELWQKIVEDFDFAYENLPLQQAEIGRPNKYAAASYLAKAYLYKAYRQDEKHDVVDIDKTELQLVVDLTDEVMGSPYRLEADFAYNFLPGSYENGPECLFAVQYSHDDGTKWGRLNFGNALTTPTSGGDFNKPSQSLVNAFKTVGGLPDFSNFNDNNYDSATDKADPRLFHTVAIPGNPYKYTTEVFSEDQSRNKAMYGVFSSLKENVDPNYEGYVSIGNWFANSKNNIVIRYADVLLMRAEALIELNRHADALPLINQVRARAKASTALVSFAGNMDIALYPDDATWTEDYARQALRWERRLEMAMEGSRFFDLVRWGVADEVMNAYYEKEKVRAPYHQNASFTKNKNEYVPIPDEQIRLSHRIYEQNYGF